MKRRSLWLRALLVLGLGACESTKPGTPDAGMEVGPPFEAGADLLPVDANLVDSSDAVTPPAWYWGNGTATEAETVAFVGYDQGCTQFGELNDVSGGVAYRVGYRLKGAAVDRLKHFGGPSPEEIDDGPLAGYAVAGTVLLIRAVREQLDPQGNIVTTALTPLQRFVATPPPSATEVSFSGTLPVAAGNPCPPGDPLCRARIEPTFVVVWQQAETNTRAYQFIRPYKVAPHLVDPTRFADCPSREEGATVGGSFHQNLGVYWPLRQGLARRLEGAPEPTRWTAWLDEVLPRAPSAGGCPPDVASPIPTVSCPVEREAIAGKFDPDAQARFQSRPGPHRVMVMVRGGAKVCPLPMCPDRGQPCPERDRITARWQAENRAAQSCVRDLVGQLGGVSSAETFWLVNVFEATLFWPQIQLVAAHPHVQHIDAADTDTPPP